MDPDKRRALSDFYREEFLKHWEQLMASGIINESNRHRVDRVYRRFLTDLESVCWHADFPAKAECLLQGFETLTRLSQLDTNRGH